MEISKLGQELTKEQLKSINGGAITVHCRFNDGLGYDFTYENEVAGAAAVAYCFSKGGKVIHYNNT